MTDRLGRYEILEKIGEGGFAIVYRARDLELDRLVALKELRSLLLTDEMWVKRFRREAKAIARLDHPRIVPIYDIGQAENRHFLVMRLIDGTSLDGLILRRERLPWPEVVEIATATAEGLDYAHAQNILHRDLKPGNILVDLERGPMLTDFGFAKLIGDSSRSMSMSGDIVGTPHYIAPEAWEGARATPQTDIYALGCILYEMVTGEKLFQGETPPAVMMAHFQPLDLPQRWPQETPAAIAQILRMALARKPTDRYPTAGEMARALADLTDGSEIILTAAAAPVEKIERNDKLPDPSTAETAPTSATGEASDFPESSEIDEAEVWRQKAEQALAAGNLEGARSAIYQWQELAPNAPAVVEFRRRLEPHLQAADMTPPPQSVAGPGHEKKGRGCLWVSGIVGFLLVVIVLVGVGGLCSTLNQTIASIAEILPTVEVGDTVEEEFTIPFPAEPETLEDLTLVIEFDSGQLTLRPGAETALVEGMAQFNVEQIRPEINVEANEIHLGHESSIGLAGFTTSNLKNEWTLHLAPVPLALSIDATATRGDFELGDLALTDLRINQGAADFELAFSEPNRVEMEQLEYKGVGSFDTVMTGLANAQAEEIIFNGGLGDFTMDFSGDLQRDLSVTIDGGAGNFILIVPEGVPAEVTVNDEANVTPQGVWEPWGDGYLLPGEGFRITFDVNVDQLRLRNR